MMLRCPKGGSLRFTSERTGEVVLELDADGGATVRGGAFVRARYDEKADVCEVTITGEVEDGRGAVMRFDERGVQYLSTVLIEAGEARTEHTDHPAS